MDRTWIREKGGTSSSWNRWKEHPIPEFQVRSLGGPTDQSQHRGHSDPENCWQTGNFIPNPRSWWPCWNSGDFSAIYQDLWYLLWKQRKAAQYIVLAKDFPITEGQNDLFSLHSYVPSSTPNIHSHTEKERPHTHTHTLLCLGHSRHNIQHNLSFSSIPYMPLLQLAHPNLFRVMVLSKLDNYRFWL